MKDFLLALTVIITMVTVKSTADSDWCIDRNINCTAVEQEYNTGRIRCRETFTPCMVKGAMCRAQEFCSDQCRDIYHKVLRCRNDTDGLHYLNLYCALSNDPKHQNSSCIQVFFENSQPSSYGYGTRCLFETATEFAQPCMPVCRDTLLAYKNDCCAIDLAIARYRRSGEDNEVLINNHNHRLWDHCGVESPEICPAPSCPMETHTPADTPTVPIAEEETGAAAAAPTHHVNWFLFVTVPLLLLYV